MSFDRIVIWIMAAFFCMGGLDRLLGNRFGLGKEFEKGFMTIGPLALSMIGIMVLAPVIGSLLSPVFAWYRQLGDPAVLAGSILACDMGGAPLADAITEDVKMAQFGGLIVSSMMGVTVSFTIPVAMRSVSERDRNFVSKGILCGIATVPLGCFAGGLMLGIPPLQLLKNCIPILVLSLLIGLGMWLAERVLLICFQIFGKLLIALATVGLVAAGIELTTGLTVIPGLASMEESFAIIGGIAVVLAGAFPMMFLLKKLLRVPLEYLGKLLKMNASAVSGILSTLVNSIATFDALGEMDDRGKTVNMAFAVSGAFVFGDHLAFVAGYASEAIPALIVGKLTAGIAAAIIAYFITKEKKHV